MTSKLLIDEPPLQVLPTLACRIGLNGAIVLQQVHYWLMIAKKAKDDRKFKDGRWWVYNSYDEWQENFPWWSLPTIKRTIYRLEEKNLLISTEMNAAGWDHTKWYSINYDVLNELTDSINLNQSVGSNEDDGEGQSDPILNSNTETTTKTTAEIIKEKNSCIEILQDLGRSVFGNNVILWSNFRRRLEKETVVITGDEKQMTIKGLNDKVNSQFTEAQVWQDKYAPSFAKFGLLISFQE